MASHSWSEVYSVVVILRSSAFVGVFHEGHGGDLQGKALAPHFCEQFCAERTQAGGHVAHRDRRIQARAEAARCDLSDRLASACISKQKRTLADGRAALSAQADAAPGRAIVEVREDLLGTRKTAGARTAGAAALLDRPFQRGLDRRGRGVDVMTIEAEPGF